MTYPLLRLGEETGTSPFFAGTNSPLSRHQYLTRLLAIDRVLSDAQLRRLGLKGEALPSLTLTVSPLTTSCKKFDVTLRTLDKRDFLVNSVGSLLHLVGLAQLRLDLGVDQSRWNVIGGGAGTRPDGELLMDGAVLAVEFDAGYVSSLCDAKIQAFMENYDGVIWGTTSELRAQRLQVRYPDVHVLTVDYWS